MVTLYEAHNQWASRPADERFWTIDDMARACRVEHDNSAIAKIKARDLEFTDDGNDVVLVGKRTGANARMTHFAFGQECSAVKAPASYLRELPAPLAARCLNESHQANAENKERHLLFHRNGGLVLRGSTSPRYRRIWNYEVAEKLSELQSRLGWKVPPGRAPWNATGVETRTATEDDCIDDSFWGSIRPGEIIAPSGLYASAHEMFAFMVHPERVVKGPNQDRQLMRGFFIRNSEVGAGSFELVAFLADGVCGNHFVWGAQTVERIKLRHTGEAQERWKEMARLVEMYTHQDDFESVLIEKAVGHKLGDGRDEVIEMLNGKKIASRKVAGAAIDIIVDEFPEDGDPLTAWGFSSGLTRLSQRGDFADARVQLDRAAGRVMEMAF